MDNRNLKDAYKRAHFARIEETRLVLRALLKDRSVPQAIRFHMSMVFHALPKHSALTTVRNRCVQTGRAKSVYRRLKLSRICLRERMATGSLPGIKKASW